MSVIALVPAAGMGRRMKSGINKQYLAIDDRPILAHTLKLFEDHPVVTQIWVISPRPEIELCRREVVEAFGFTKVREIVAGGAERQDSVRNGLEACAAADNDIVLIHDGVRPLLPPALIGPLAAQARESGACLTAVPAKDTIKEVNGGKVTGTPDRRRLWLAQTPQAFRYRLILEAHRRARAEGFQGTDDASLVERLGHPVAVVEGSYRNIKITTPEDLVVARALLHGAEEEDHP